MWLIQRNQQVFAQSFIGPREPKHNFLSVLRLCQRRLFREKLWIRALVQRGEMS